MVLLDDVVQIFDLPDGDGIVGVDVVQCLQVGRAAVDGHRVGLTMVRNGLLEKAPCRSLVALGAQQKVEGMRSRMRLRWTQVPALQTNVHVRERTRFPDARPARFNSAGTGQRTDKTTFAMWDGGALRSSGLPAQRARWAARNHTGASADWAGVPLTLKARPAAPHARSFTCRVACADKPRMKIKWGRNGD